MPGFNIGGAVNSAAGWVSGAPIVGKVVGNPIMAALLITAIIAIVLIAMFRHSLAQISPIKKARAVLYIFMLVTGVLFVHQYAVVNAAKDTAMRRDVRDVFDSINSSSGVTGGFRPQIGGQSENMSPPRHAFAAKTTGGDEDCGCERPDNVKTVDPKRAARDFDIEEIVLPATSFPRKK